MNPATPKNGALRRALSGAIEGAAYSAPAFGLVGAIRGFQEAGLLGTIRSALLGALVGAVVGAIICAAGRGIAGRVLGAVAGALAGVFIGLGMALLGLGVVTTTRASETGADGVVRWSTTFWPVGIMIGLPVGLII